MRRPAAVVVGCALGLGLAACLKVAPFRGGDGGVGDGKSDGKSDGGAGCDAGSGGSNHGLGLEVDGSDGGSGITVTGSFFTLHFADTGAHYPDVLRFAGGSNLIAATTIGCADAGSGVGISLFPTFQTESITGENAQILLAGPAVVKIGLAWSASTACTSTGASAAVHGHTQFTILPDGKITRWDDFTIDTPLQTGSAACTCVGGVDGPFALAAYETFVGSAANLFGPMGMEGSDDAYSPAGSNGGVTSGNTDTDDLCLTTGSGTDAIVFHSYFADQDSLGRYVVSERTPGTMTFAEEFLGSASRTAIGSGDIAPSKVALELRLVHGTVSCQDLAMNAEAERDVNALQTTGLDVGGGGSSLVSYADKDHLYGGEQSPTAAPDVAAPSGTTLTFSPLGTLPTGFGIHLFYDRAPRTGSVQVIRSDAGSDKPILMQTNAADDRDYVFWFGGGMGSDAIITITSGSG